MVDQDEMKDVANTSLPSSIANSDDLSTICIPSGWDCMEYINVLLSDDSTTNRAITTGSTSKASTDHSQNGNSSSNSNTMNSVISINPQQDTQNDQDFLKALFDQQNRNAIHLGDLSASNQSSDTMNATSSLASMEDVSTNDDLTVSIFFQILEQFCE